VREFFNSAVTLPFGAQNRDDLLVFDAPRTH